ncbi:MAG: hypothetical protein ABFD18_14390 [Syntrophomonas sp.]
MNCPNCSNPMPDENYACPDCGFDFNKCSWIVISKVYPPNDIIIESLLKSCDIPVKLFHEAIGPIQGLAIGPLAEVRIAVPEIMADAAVELLKSEAEDSTI